MEACANWFCSVGKAKKGGSLKGKSNGTHCIEASSDVDDKEWNSRDIDQKGQLSHHNKQGFPL
jgi:hypothetical protein